MRPLISEGCSKFGVGAPEALGQGVFQSEHNVTLMAQQLQSKILSLIFTFKVKNRAQCSSR